jgi:hypothetical protein
VERLADLIQAQLHALEAGCDIGGEVSHDVNATSRVRHATVRRDVSAPR